MMTPDKHNFHLINGQVCEQSKSVEGYSIYYVGDEPIAVHHSDFHRLKQENDRLRTFLHEMSFEMDPQEAEHPCCASLCEFVLEEIEEVREDLEVQHG